VSHGAGPVPAERLRIVPANEASCDELQVVFGTAGYPARCSCQHYKLTGMSPDETTREGRRERLRAQAACGEPGAPSTSGLVAYLDGEPVGWVAVEPRTAYARLERLRTVWRDRPEEDRSDHDVWSVTCFVVRQRYRRRGITYALAAAAVEWARRNGARAIEGYSMDTPAGKEITWGEMHVGSRSVFAAAGFEEVSHPSPRRAVMRLELG
jgi:GNAT superfamily N-acetyltransferase